MNKLLALVFHGSLLLTSPAFSGMVDPAACGEFDISASLGPVRNQKNTGWCWAYSAADALSLVAGERVSALGVVMAHNSQRQDVPSPRPLTDYLVLDGWAAHAIDRSLTEGYCLEAEVPSEAPDLDLPAAVGAVEKSLGWRGIFGGQNAPGNMSLLFPSVAPAALADVYARSTPTDVIANLTRTACGTRKKFPRFDRYFYGHGLGRDHGDRLFDSLNGSLNARHPTLIGYDATGLLPESYPDRNRMHFSLIVGRRWNRDSARCEYQIRNTWGDADRGYRTGITSVKGHQWVDEDFLKKYLYELIFLKVGSG